MKKLLLVILTFLLLIGNVTCLYAEEDETELTDETILETYDLDPDTLNIKGIGEIDPEEEYELIEAEPYSLDDIVRVSIVLDGNSTLDQGYSAQKVAEDQSAMAYREQLRANQEMVTRAIEEKTGEALDVKWNLTLAVNLISANVRYKDIVKIESVPGVKKVEIENCYEVQEDEINTSNSSSFMVGATSAWAGGYTGAGQKIAIIDTGIDTSHQSFSADAFNYAIDEIERVSGVEVGLLVQNEVVDLWGQLNASQKMQSGASNVYLNEKVPYRFNYIDKNTDVTHLNDTEGEHGSHVAGIAAANRYIKNGTSYEEAIDYVKAVGMAPDAQLLVMKVFGKGGGAYDSDYMAAIEDALVLGCDSVNLSLGSSQQGFTYSDTYQGVLNRLSSSYNEGTVVTISAGNAYALTEFLETDLYIDDVSMHTGGSPGTFINSLGTAAAQNIGATGAPINAYDKNIYYTDAAKKSMPSIAGTYDFVYIDSIGETSDYSAVNQAVSLNGKVVLVNRGELNFSEKADNAASVNLKALIIVNNAPGTISMDLSDYSGSFPVASITLSDGQYLKSNSTSSSTGGITYYTGSLTITNTIIAEKVAQRENAEITDFSSWGVPGSLIMKPEITAPGGDIYSVFGTNKTENGDTTGGSDQYELMSGTSMAAPHMAGLAAVVAQYVKENNIEFDDYSRRALIQSLLMSTATPMKNNGKYVSILQQGAGLVEASKAVEASSVIFMNEAGLTSSTGAAADGKVKVEFGDDPNKSGNYSYSFTLYNLTNNDLSYSLETEMFTQDHYEADGDVFMAQTTTPLDVNATYVWRTENSLLHDVNLDGIVNDLDAEAILDKLTGEISEADASDETQYDWEQGEMDGDEVLSSHDAYMLRNYIAEEQSGYILPANGKADVKVTIQLTDEQKDELDEIYTSGAYIEGFTYVTCNSSDNEGVSYQHEHSIPLLGFYSSWTDPSMFDNTSYTDVKYGTEKVSYTGNSETNYMTLTYNGTSEIFVGNKYIVEDEFPYDRLAINSNSKIGIIVYSLVRSAGTTGFALSNINEQGDVTDVINSSVIAINVPGIWYYQRGRSWKNTGSKTYSVNKTASSFGLCEGNRFRVGVYAIPEYNAMKYNGNMADTLSGILNSTGFKSVIESNVLGDGSYIGFDFVVDDTKPVISSATMNGNEISIEASDNYNLAYIGVLSLDGSVVYKEVAPSTNEYTFSFNATDAIENAPGYVAVFAGDYAGNEVAKAIKVNDNTSTEKTVYLLTDTLTVGEEYLIVNSNRSGSAYALSYDNKKVSTKEVSIKTGINETDNAVYVDLADVTDASVLTLQSGYRFMNNNSYLSRNMGSLRFLTTISTNNVWSWDGTNHTLSGGGYYIVFDGSTFRLDSNTDSIFLYKKTTVSTDLDPYHVDSISITPESLDLYKGNEADLIAQVLPLSATDQSVIWSSSDNDVVSVDEYGHVTALKAGSAIITATSNQDSNFSASCSINVTSIDKSLNGVVWDEEANVYFSSFNSGSLPTWNKLHDTNEVLPIHSAFMTSSALYAGTLDDSSLETTIYSVNRNNYSLTEHGTNFIGATDMAIGATTYSDYVGFVYTYAYYLIAGPIDPGDDGEGGMYSGLPYAVLDNTENNSNAYFVGVACKSRSRYGGTYYVLDENGVIWQTTLGLNDAQNGFVFSAPEKVMETGIGTSFLYQSLYFDGTNLYWSHEADNHSELIIINPDSKAVYHAGNFGEGIWPVAGLYVDGKVAPASIDEVMDDADPIETSIRISRDELMTDEIMERFRAEAKKNIQKNAVETVEEPENNDSSEFAEENVDDEIVYEEPIEENCIEEDPIVEEQNDFNEIAEESNRINGSLNSIKENNKFVLKKLHSDITVPEKRIESYEGKDDEDDYVFVKIYEEEAATNGLYEIHYDPTALTLVQADETSSDCYSVHVNEENGLIRFAFAVKDIPYLAEEIINRIKFEKPNKDTEVTGITIEKNESLQMTEETIIPFIDDRPSVTLSSSSLYLQGKVGVNFKFIIPEELYNDDTFIVITQQKRDEQGNVIEITDGSNVHTFKATEGTLDAGKLVFTVYEHIKELYDVLNVRVTDASGNPIRTLTSKGRDITEGYDYDVVNSYIGYWKQHPSAQNAEMIAFMSDLQNYSDAARLYFNYNLSGAAIDYDLIADISADDVADFGAIISGTLPDGIAHSAASLLLEEVTTINHKFTLTGNDNIEAYTFKVEGKKVIPFLKDGKYVVEVPNIHAKDLDRYYNVEVTKQGSDCVYSVDYAAFSYIRTALKGDDVKLNDMLRTMIKYNQSANTYFSN